MTPGILYIEDDLGIQRAIGRMLGIEYPKFQVYIVDSAVKAINSLEHNQYDLVISDYRLKAGTGADVLEWIKVNRPNLVKRFIYLASSDEIETHMHWVKKPARSETLCAVINHVLALP